MTKRLFLILFLSLLVFITGACRQKQNVKADGGYVVTDVTGKEVRIPHKPKRIVTLSIYTDQIVLGLVNTGRMAAVNNYLDDPKESNIVEKAKKIKYKVKNPGTEEMLSWQPDLIIASLWTPMEQITAYKDLGIPVIVCNRGSNYKEVQECVRIIAAAVDEKEKGQQMLARMDEEMAKTKALIDKIPPDKKKRVMLLSVMTDFGGEGSSFDDMCKYAGLINTMTEAGLKNGQTLTKEMIIKCNPDIIFLPDYDNHGKFNRKRFLDNYLKDPAMQTVPAIKNNELYMPRDCYIYNCSQDYVYGVREIASFAYGSEFNVPDGANISLSGE